MAAPKIPRVVVAGLVASVFTGVVECIYAFSIGSGLNGVWPSALFCLQVVAWTAAAAAPLVLIVHVGGRFAGDRWRALLNALRNPTTDTRWSIWIAVLGTALATYLAILFALAEHQLIGKRARGASTGSFVIAAAGALLVLAAAALATGRLIVRRVAARPSRPRPFNPPRVVLSLAAVGALHVSLVSAWLTSSLEIGFGLDLRIAIVPAFFIVSWSALYRMPALPLRLPTAVQSQTLRFALLVAFVALVSAGLLTIGQRADADAALVSRSFVPRIMLALLHPPEGAPANSTSLNNESPLPEPPDTTDGTGTPLPLDPAASASNSKVAPTSMPSGAKPNILLITIDTLRADHLGAYGYGRATSPEIDRFAKSAVVFKRVYAAAPNTPRSIPSILTSRYPSQIPWRNAANYPPLPKGIPTLAQDLEAAGYKNHAILTHWYFRRERGLARGFHTWDTSLVDDDIETGREESAPRVTERARRLLARAREAKKPFFLWVHYFEPHHFYILHKDTPTFGTAMMDKYDHEIRFVDREVGRLLKHVDDLGLDKTTAVILTSDHGEAFGEHAKYWHGHALYDEQLRVPLIVRTPSSNVPPHQSEVLVSLVDLRPTIAEIAGVKPMGPVAGRSLVPALRGDVLPPRAIFAEILPQPNYAAHQRMVLRGSWKLIEDVRMRSVELFDLATDTRELKNEATRSRNVVDQLRASPASLNGIHP